MELRPVAVFVPEGMGTGSAEQVTGGVRTYGFFKAMQKAMKGEYGKTARSKLKELRTAVKQGRTSAEFFLHDKQIRDLLYHAFTATYQTAEERKREYQKLLNGTGDLRKELFAEIDGVTRCLFFDAVEMIDHFKPLEEVEA